MALFPPTWDLLDKPSKSVTLLSLEEFTDIVNGCSPDALRRNSFVIFRIVCMARYLSLKTQEVHEALQEAHSAMGLAKISPERPTDETDLTEQDATSVARQQEALVSAAARAQAERARVAEQNNTELRGQLAQAQTPQTPPSPSNRSKRKHRIWTIG